MWASHVRKMSVTFSVDVATIYYIRENICLSFLLSYSLDKEISFNASCLTNNNNLWRRRNKTLINFLVVSRDLCVFIISVFPKLLLFSHRGGFSNKIVINFVAFYFEPLPEKDYILKG